MQLVSKTDNTRISNLASVKTRLTSDYLTNQGDKQTSFVVAKYFKEDTKFLEVLNISFNLLNNMCSIYNDYTGKPNLNYEIDIEGVAYDMAWAGYSVMVASIVDGFFTCQKVNPENYVRDSETQERLLFAYEVENNDTINYYILEKKYIVSTTSIKDDNGIITKQGKTTIENKLYKLSSKGSLQNATEVPLSTIPETTDIPPAETLAIGRSPIFVFNNQKINNLFYGSSEYDKVKSIIQSIEIQSVNIQDQLLKHLQAKLLLPRMALPTRSNTNGEKFVDLSKLEVLEVEEGATFTPQYVTNTNNLIQHAFTLFELLLSRFCGVSQIPKELLSITSEGGSEAYSTKLIRFSVFIKKIEKYRDVIQKQLKEIDNVRNQLGFGDGSKFICLWDSVLPADSSVEITNLISLRNSGLISKLKAIMQAQDISLEEAEKELLLIDGESENIDFEGQVTDSSSQNNTETNDLNNQ